MKGSPRRSASVSRHGSFRSGNPMRQRTIPGSPDSIKSNRSSRPQSICGGDENKENESSSKDADDDYEWVWEDDEEEDEDLQQKDLVGSPTTMDRLEEVKSIIEKPEDRWRIMWEATRENNVSSPVGSVHSNTSSYTSNFSNASKMSNLIQPGVDGDPLSLVKVRK